MFLHVPQCHGNILDPPPLSTSLYVFFVDAENAVYKRTTTAKRQLQLRVFPVDARTKL